MVSFSHVYCDYNINQDNTAYPLRNNNKTIINIPYTKHNFDRPLLGRNAVGDKGPFKLVVKTFIGDRTAGNLLNFFPISRTYSVTRTPPYGTNFIKTHTLNTEWFYVNFGTMLSVYWTSLRYSLT